MSDLMGGTGTEFGLGCVQAAMSMRFFAAQWRTSRLTGSRWHASSSPTTDAVGRP